MARSFVLNLRFYCVEKQAFVSCGWGISNIGFVMICFGVCNGLAAIFTGSIVKITGRGPVICFALSLHVALIVSLLVWRPSLENKLIFFVVSGLWGICDAVWLVNINGKPSGSYPSSFGVYVNCAFPLFQLSVEYCFLARRRRRTVIFGSGSPLGL